jgi:hypothetical protein
LKYSPHSYLDILSHFCASCISYAGVYEIDFILLQEKRPSKIEKTLGNRLCIFDSSLRYLSLQAKSKLKRGYNTVKLYESESPEIHQY